MVRSDPLKFKETSPLENIFRSKTISFIKTGSTVLQTGSGFKFCMGNVSVSIAALCHAKNLPELETWFRNIIMWEWEGGTLDKYVEILRIVNNA